MNTEIRVIIDTSQGMPATTRNWKRPGIHSLLNPPEGMQPCHHLDFRLLAFQMVREYTSLLLSCQVQGNLLQQCQETNTLEYKWMSEQKRVIPTQVDFQKYFQSQPLGKTQSFTTVLSTEGMRVQPELAKELKKY